MDQLYIASIISSDKQKSSIYNNLIIKNNLEWKKFDESHILSWLHNFSPSEEDIYLALILANKIMFYSKRKIHYLWRFLLYNKLKIAISEKYFTGQSLSEINRSFQKFIENKCIFTPFGSAGDSGEAMHYDFSHVVGNSRLKNIDLSFLIANFDQLKEDECKNRDTIILIDDFIGSGNQATNFWDKRKFVNKTLKDLHEKNPEIRFYYLALCGMAEGVSEISSSLPITVIVGEELDDRFKCFSTCSQIFSDPEERRKAEILMTTKGKYLYSHPLGYKNSQLAIAFDHNTPNNSLPVIWKKKTDGSWYPLFKRYGEEEE